ncbi:malto-oligosyltrehalose synthase [Micromonospora sp. NPDC126480]|uniref:malto-oligosyltrehalose synthase n=1 Tax=Micromonospora sp. NPDC126480 TaxID=3155312 RepID=UPI00331C8A52
MPDTPRPDPVRALTKVTTPQPTHRVGATYRLQVRPGFDLDAAAGLAGYLADLGVTHLYSAPLLTASPGSQHGYDVVDHRHVNPELGGEPARQRLMHALRAAGLGLVVDIVPNHAGVARPAANPAWWDVLRRGRESAYAGWFDIDWQRGRLLLPVLADDPAALDDLKVFDGELRYHEHRFPIADGTGDGTPREVHDRQHYELVNWRRGDAELTYRRFFAVSDLAGLRVEDPEVFAATHDLVLRWARAGEIDGIRVDHPDGLRDPAEYLARLREAAGPVWLIVEKILEYGEELPDWPVDGTTGYEALSAVSGLFIDPDAEADFTALDTRLAGRHTSWQDLTHDTKLEAATRLLSAELTRLTTLAPETAPHAVRAALAELAAAYAVYRGYPPEGARHLAAARAEAGRRRPDLAGVLDALTRRLRDPDDELAKRFPQFTGAVMAKGVEDTAFYRWSRFVALNEVGGSPAHFGTPPAEFHRFAAARHVRWPAAMTTISTHDTKRSEDVRARLAVLSELPERWAVQVGSWMARVPLPDPEFAHLLWQTAVGAWPVERERLHAYAEKAAREASTATSWADPDPAFEAAMHDLVDALYDDAALRAELDAFASSITHAGWSNSLGQKLVQLAMPGVPDTYQGTELWDNSLVDPDNRRPVDFAVRREMLARLDAGWRPPVDESGAAKLLVVSRTLRLRRDRPELFTGYRPLPARGPAARHVIAFDRGSAIAVATRLPLRLAASGGWRDTTLPISVHAVTDMFTGRVYSGSELLLHDLLSTYPVALLAPTDSVEAAA